MDNLPGNDKKPASAAARSNNDQQNSQPQQQHQEAPVPETPATTSNSQPLVKAAEDKCNEIYAELKKLDVQAETFAGRKDDKSFLKLEEFLTVCVLRLDEIERSDERVNQLRKKLIKFSDEITAKLEQRARENEAASN
jgi:hypothetical protein